MNISTATLGPQVQAAASKAPPVPSRRSEFGTWVLSILLAFGFSLSFLGPLYRFSNPPESTGVIAGARVSEPLRVSVTISQIGRQTRTDVQPQSSTLPETLSRAAEANGGSFSYLTRGQGMYLQTFLDRSQGDSGHWTISHNGLLVNDLSQVTLRQQDEVLVAWEPNGL